MVEGSGSNVRTPRKRAARRSTAATKPNGDPVTELAPGDRATAHRKTSPAHSWKSSRVLWGSVLLGVAAGLYLTRRSR